MRFTFKSGILIASAGLFVTLSGLAIAQDINNNETNYGETVPTIDMHFARQAAIDNMAQIDEGSLAADRAYFYRVRDFGKRMMEDHTRLNNELKAIALQDNLALPNTLTPEADAALNRIAGLTGPRFDREFMTEMVLEHEKAVAAFQNESIYGMNHDLRKWATDSLPIVQEHLRLARDIQIAEQDGETSGFVTRK